MRWINQDRLDKLITRAIESPHSDFHRKRIPSFAGLESLPFLTRKDLAETPVETRTFVSREDVRFVGYTSGTTSGKPLITPVSDVENYFFEPSLGMGITRPLIIYPPLNKNFGHTFIQQCRQAQNPVTPVFGDTQNLANSAILARETGCDAIYATPTIASLVHEHIERHYDPKKIRLLALSSETLTPARRDELSRMYPEARIANLYASSEIGQFILFPCPHIIEAGRDEFHILEEAITALELNGEDEGELVVSYDLNKASPLIRYRTGDHFKVVGTNCPCGIKSPILAWSHRDSVDRVRVNGVEFLVSHTDQIMASIPHLFRPQYQIHFRQGLKTAVSITIEIEDPTLSTDTDRTETLAQLVRDHLLSAWRVGQASSLAEAVSSGLFDTPKVVFVTRLSHQGAKTRRLISHLD
jgi:phenylacetate-CoA ligase